MNKHLTHTHCLIAIAVAVVAIIAFGGSASSLFVLGAVIACPLMMVFMMRGMMSGTAASRDDTSEKPTSVGQPR